jgi:hypothetical protein
MINDDDETTTIDLDPDVMGEIEMDDVEETEPAEAPRARKAARKKRAAKKSAPKARKAAKAAPAAAPAKKIAKKPVAKKAASKASRSPAGLTRVKAGSQSLWTTADLAKALSAKDRKKLKAIFKRAAKRGKQK